MSDRPLDERRRAAQRVRELTFEITTADADDTEFAAVAAALEPLCARLANNPRIALAVDGLHTKEHAAVRSGREPAYDRDPLIGLSNPLAPPLARSGGLESNEWEVTFGDAYGGHPGLVHGGYVAAVLDHVLGVAASSSGFASMTGTLTTRFCRPTPVNVRLTCVGRVDRVEGRKVFCSAELDASGTVVAEAHGVYLRVEPDRYRTRDARERAPAGSPSPAAKTPHSRHASASACAARRHRVRARIPRHRTTSRRHLPCMKNLCAWCGKTIRIGGGRLRGGIECNYGMCGACFPAKLARDANPMSRREIARARRMHRCGRSLVHIGHILGAPQPVVVAALEAA